MLEWCVAVLLVAASVLLLLLPGYLVLRALGASGSLAVLGAPGVGVLTLTAASVVMPALGLRWTWVSAAGLLALPCVLSGTAALLVLVRPRTRLPSKADSTSAVLSASIEAWRSLGRYLRTFRLRARSAVGMLVGMCLAALLQLVVLVRSLRTPSAILQNHDVMFHLNYIAQITRSGNASPLGSARDVNGGAYYPNLWHTLAASLPGVDVPTAFNVVVLLVALFLMPLGCVLLGRAVGGGALALALAPLAGSFTMWFPALPLYFHGQVPTALSVALLLLALAALLEWYRQKSSPAAAAVVVVSAGGAAVAHAGAGEVLVVVTAALAILWSGQRLRRRGRGRSSYLVSLLPALLALAALYVMTSLPALGDMAGYERDSKPVGEVVVDVLTLAPVSSGMESSSWLHYWPLALGAVGGVCLAAWRRRWEVPVMWGAVAALVLLTASPAGWWQALVGGWWRDEARYLGLLAVLSGVLAATAAEAVAVWCWHQVRTGTRLLRLVGAAVGAMTVIAVLVAAGVGAGDASTWARRGYNVSALIHIPWVTPEEELFIREVAPTLPSDAVVYGYPASGAGLFPALTGIDSHHRTVTSRGAPADEAYLAYHFRDILSDPDVCEIITAGGGTPLYYQDSAVPAQAVTPDFGGYADVDTRHGFTLLAARGTVSIWEITACGRP